MEFTEEEIIEFYDTFKSAYLALASGVQSYTINTGGSARTVTRANLETIREEFFKWARLKNQITGKNNLGIEIMNINTHL